MPSTAPAAKARTASSIVMKRCFQMEPAATQLTTRAAMSLGFEKKNGSSTFAAASPCHVPSNAAPSAACTASSCARDSGGLALIATEDLLLQVLPDGAVQVDEA